MHPSDFLVLAGKIVNSCPAGARSAVSRAYYAVFHQASLIFADLRMPVPGSGPGHALLVQYLQSAMNEMANEMGDLIGDLHAARLKSDYRLSETRWDDTHFAMREVEVAHEVQTRLFAFRETCRRDQAVVSALQSAYSKVNSMRKPRL